MFILIFIIIIIRFISGSFPVSGLTSVPGLFLSCVVLFFLLFSSWICLAPGPWHTLGRGTEAERVHYWSGHRNCVSSVLLSLFIVLTGLTGLIDRVLCDLTNLFEATPLAGCVWVSLTDVWEGTEQKRISLSRRLVQRVVSSFMRPARFWDGFNLCHLRRSDWVRPPCFEAVCRSDSRRKRTMFVLQQEEKDSLYSIFSEYVCFSFSECSCLLRHLRL